MARIFNAHGPRMHHADGRVVSNFVVQVLQGDPVTICGSGDLTRSLCHVDDLISDLIALMASDAPLTGPINLGNPKEFSIREFAEETISMNGSDQGLTFRDLPQDDPKKRRPDISMTISQIGWRPTIELGQGLKQTVASLRTRLPDITQSELVLGTINVLLGLHLASRFCIDTLKRYPAMVAHCVKNINKIRRSPETPN